MYKVVLKNVGSNMVNKSFQISGSDINYVVGFAYDRCVGILGSADNLHFSVVGEEINVVRNGVLVGSLTITKIG